MAVETFAKWGMFAYKLVFLETGTSDVSEGYDVAACECKKKLPGRSDLERALESFDRLLWFW